MLKCARFFLGVTFKMASNYVQDEIRAAVREEVSRMLGSSRTECEISEGISPSTSLVNLRPSERTLSFEEFYKKREDDHQNGFKPPPPPEENEREPFRPFQGPEIDEC